MRSHAVGLSLEGDKAASRSFLGADRDATETKISEGPPSPFPSHPRVLPRTRTGRVRDPLVTFLGFNEIVSLEE